MKVVAGVFGLTGLAGAAGYAVLDHSLRGLLTAAVILLYALVLSGFVLGFAILLDNVVAIRRMLEGRPEPTEPHRRRETIVE